MLETLSERGLPGVTELLKNTMTVLKSSMEGRTSIQQTGTQETGSQATGSQRTSPQRRAQGLSSQ